MALATPARGVLRVAMSGVSLIIPCFNQAAFVSAAINSVLAQSVPPTEIIVVDDGSTDGSAEQVERFGSSARLFSQPNRGAAAARNMGVRQSRSGLIAFLDSDDLWPVNSLAMRLELLRRSGADFVFGGVRQFRQGSAHNADGDRSGAARVAGAMLVRRESLQRVGPFDEQLRSAEVIDWVARAEARGLTSAAISEIVLFRRIHGANMMLTDAESAASRLAVLRANVGRKRAVAAP